MADHHHKVFNSNDYIPKRFGLNYSPPQIIIEYLAPSTGKLYHHKMRLHKFKKEKNNAEIIKELYERHQVYLDKKKVDVVIANNKKVSDAMAKRYESEEQKDPVLIDREVLDEIGIELIEDDLIIIDTDNTLKHNSLKLSSLIFSYLMRK